MFYYPLTLTEDEEKVDVPNGRNNTGMKGIIYDKWNNRYKVTVNVNGYKEVVTWIPSIEEAIKVYKKLYYLFSNRPNIGRKRIEIPSKEEAMAEIVSWYVPNNDQGIKEIELSQGMVAIVDAKNYDWLIRPGKWSYHPQRIDEYIGYAWKQYKYQQIYMHTVIGRKLGLKGKIDHRNRNSLDNTELNLREATHSENMMNRQTFKNNTSGRKGVYYNVGKDKWEAKIFVNKQDIYLGAFFNKEDATKAREEAEIKYFRDYNCID